MQHPQLRTYSRLIIDQIDLTKNEKNLPHMRFEQYVLWKRGRPEIQPANAFLSIRAQKPNENDWTKLVRLMNYLGAQLMKCSDWKQTIPIQFAGIWMQHMQFTNIWRVTHMKSHRSCNNYGGISSNLFVHQAESRCPQFNWVWTGWGGWFDSKDFVH